MERILTDKSFENYVFYNPLILFYSQIPCLSRKSGNNNNNGIVSRIRDKILVLFYKCLLLKFYCL